MSEIYIELTNQSRQDFSLEVTLITENYINPQCNIVNLFKNISISNKFIFKRIGLIFYK